MLNRPPTELKIFSGSAHRELARSIAAYCKVPLGDATVDSFPDGETMVKINENIRGRDVFIVQPTCPPTNQNLMELLIMVDARCARAPRRVHHDEEFHQVLIRRRARRLHDEHVASADVLVDLHHRLAVGK